MTSLQRIPAIVLVLLALCGLAAGQLVLRADARGATAAGPCDRVIAPHGASVARRHQRGGSVQQLVSSLRAGETGCLRGGTYVGSVTISRSRIALRAYPGERARIVGRLWVRGGAHDDVIRDLTLDGRNAARLPSPTVNGTRIRFANVDVTNHRTAICFVIGSRYGRARGTVIERSRIHDCGRRPERNVDHGIYVAAADDTRIVGNLIYENADRGIQLYPDAQRTLIEGNVIDRNGEGIIFSGQGGRASSHNVVQHNVISNARVRADVESWYPRGNPRGIGNVVRENCIFGGRRTISTTYGGFAAFANVIADPQFANAAASDFRVSRRSPCARILRAR